MLQGKPIIKHPFPSIAQYVGMLQLFPGWKGNRRWRDQIINLKNGKKKSQG